MPSAARADGDVLVVDRECADGVVAWATSPTAPAPVCASWVLKSILSTMVEQELHEVTAIADLPSDLRLYLALSVDADPARVAAARADLEAHFGFDGRLATAQVGTNWALVLGPCPSRATDLETEIVTLLFDTPGLVKALGGSLEVDSHPCDGAVCARIALSLPLTVYSETSAEGSLYPANLGCGS
jgi:hypothetical protein